MSTTATWSSCATGATISSAGAAASSISAELKVHPEEVEAAINRHPSVRMSLVKARRNPITGAIVVADVVVNSPATAAGDADALKSEILEFCRGTLERHKVPAAIHFVPALEVGAAGKLARNA